MRKCPGSLMKEIHSKLSVWIACWPPAQRAKACGKIGPPRGQQVPPNEDSPAKAAERDYQGPCADRANACPGSNRLSL